MRKVMENKNLLKLLNEAELLSENIAGGY